MRILKRQTARLIPHEAGFWWVVFASALTLSGAVTDPAVLRLGQAAAAYDKHDFFTTVHLLSAGGQPQKLRDYVTYYLANAELTTNNGDGALRELTKYEANPVPRSPYAGRITLLYAKALLGQHTPTPASIAKAREVLQTDYNLLSQPDGDFELAQAFQAGGFPRQTADYYRRVYYSYPAADLAEKARVQMDQLQASLGTDYPAPTARQQLDRADAWLNAKQYARARQEYAMLASTLTGADREMAQSGIGAAMYLDGDYVNSATWLSPLHPENAEAAAERLYYLTEIYRHLNDDTAMLDAVRQLGESYPQSPWRLKALITAGNRFLLTQDRGHYVPLYQAAAQSFPGDSAAALCQWRVVWAAWLDHSPERTQLLREQIERFPADTHVSDALFFLGREAEQESNFAAALTYYYRLATDFPHYYYGEQARARLTDQNLTVAKADPAIIAWLNQTMGAVHAATIPADITAAPNDATRQRVDRARLLIQADMPAQAVEELQYGAKQGDEQAPLLAMELSRAMPAPYLAMRVMKKFTGDYLSLPFDKAPRDFWEMLFPMPYLGALTANAMERDLDPYAVAGLIRQESEFNPGARSAVAYGLMQLIPSTGKAVGRREGIRVASAGMLLDPSLNIQLGTEYLRAQLDHWGGDWVKTLAAYNAGPERVREWIDQYGYADSAEFIENIPFTETRDYVQAVLRNGDVYRELYGPQRAVLASDVADAGSVSAAKITSVSAVSKVVARHPAAAGAHVSASAKTRAKKPAAKRTAVTAAKTAPAAKPASKSGAAATGLSAVTKTPAAKTTTKPSSVAGVKKSTAKAPASAGKSTTGHTIAAAGQERAGMRA